MAVLFYKDFRILYNTYIIICVGMKINLKIKALELRKQGLSYGDIKKKLGVSKSTISLWTNRIKIPLRAQNILAIKTAAARKKGRDARSSNLKLKYELIRQSVLKDLRQLQIDKTLAKLLCAMLYWGEGSKSSGQVVFTNSDPEMIKLFLRLFTYAFEPDAKKFRAILHLHPYHNEVKQKLFWSKVTGIALEKISIYHKTAYGHLVRENYPGCIAIHYGNMEILNELMYYYKHIDTLGGFV